MRKLWMVWLAAWMALWFAGCTKAPAGAGAPGGRGGPGGPRVVRTVEAQSGSLTRWSTFTGDVIAERQVELAAQESGTLRRLLVDEGIRVKAGELVGELDAEVQTNALEEAQRALASAESRVRQAEAELEGRRREAERLARQVERQVSAEVEAARQGEAVRVAEEAVAVARAQVGEVRAVLATRRTALERRRIVAPFDGVVARRWVTAGAVVSPGMPLLTLVDDTSLRFVARLPESELGSLSPGMKGEVRFDAMAGTASPIAVERLGALVDPVSRTVEVRFVVESPAGPLRPGMFGRGRLALETRGDGVLLPADALVRTAEGGWSVWAVEDEKLKRVPVELLLSHERERAVSGLAAGTPVVSTVSQAFREGDPVKPRSAAAGEGN